MSAYQLANSEENPLREDLDSSLTDSPQAFEAAIAQVQSFVLQVFDREIVQNKLYYHTREHVKAVQRRANTIFQAVRPFWKVSLDPKTADSYLLRMRQLLDLCCFAHDMVQIFDAQTQPNTSRRREAGLSETVTIDQLLNYIDHLNQRSQNSAVFTEADLTIIRDSIRATICAYDTNEQAIYQPLLYDFTQRISPIARMIALADIGALGMDGIDAYNQEGCLLFLEENPDILALLAQGVAELKANNPELAENVRQRLLRRARFQVSFAKSRLSRSFVEISVFPEESIPILANQVFRHLHPETIREIEQTTPTDEETSLETLLTFFQFEQLVLENER